MTQDQPTRLKAMRQMATQQAPTRQTTTRQMPAFVPCERCPLRRKAAFMQKDEKEVSFINGLKSAHLRFAAGSQLIQQGTEEPNLFTLFSGWAFRHKSLPDGNRQILSFLLPGDLAGLQATLQAEAEHGIDALTDVELCIFPRRKLLDVFEKAPALAYDLAWLGSREERMIDENLLSVGQRGAAERMVALILGLYRRAEHLDLVENQSFLFPLTKQHLADALGLSLVHASKTWSSLQRLNIFTYADRRLTLVNPRATERIASYFDRDWRVRPIL
jgi:CRP-like cAMP-binding protein